MSFFVVVLLLVVLVAIVLVLLSRAPGASEALGEQLETPALPEDDPEVRAEDTAQMLEADNRNRDRHGEPAIGASEAEVQTERQQAEAEALPEQEGRYVEQLDSALERDTIDPDDAPRSVEEGAHRAAEDRLSSN